MAMGKSAELLCKDIMAQISSFVAVEVYLLQFLNVHLF